MAHRSKRSRSAGGSTGSLGFESGGERNAQPFLVTATDVCLWMTFFGVTVCFGGRAAVGQLILVVGAALTAGCWLLHQLTARESRCTWTGSEWLWLAGIAIGVSQIIPLPREWMLAVSPQIGKILLPPSGSNSASLGVDVWSQLSLAPWETASGLATFVSYSLLFLVAVQRVQTMADVERTMFGVGIVAVAMAAFAQVQYCTSNGKFFWFYLHPYMATNLRPTGCFTNRNHLAQFLALGVGPLIWCVLRRLEPKESERADSGVRDPETRLPANRNLVVPIAVFLGLGGTVLTALSTLSRGGLLAIAIAIAVSVGVLWRLGRVSATVCLGLVVVVSAIGAIFNLTGNEASLAARIGGESGREYVWRANIAVAREFPILGTGVGTHADAHQLHLDKQTEGGEFTHAESGYLQVLSETGFVGLGLAVLFILASLWWCCGALRNPDTRVSSVAAVVLASLLANVTHAVGDFFWYTPSCMLLLAIQLACACRLYRMTQEGSGGRGQESGRELMVEGRGLMVRGSEERRPCLPPLTLNPQPATDVRGGTGRVRQLGRLTALGGVLAAGAWMVYLKLPATLAEPDQMRYITIAVAGPGFYADEEDRREAQLEKRQAAFRAVRFNPHDSRLQEQAAMAYVEWFNERQEQSENPLPLGQLRDAVTASQFVSPAAMHEWLDRAVGKNVKLLRIAMKHLRRALRESPLRAGSYVQLAELSFLDADREQTESAYLKQAVVLRPHDPEVLFAVGRNALLAGDLDRAMESWRVAFEHSQRFQGIITDLLAGQVTPEFFLEKLKPGWNSIALLARAFTKAGREDEARQMWVRFVSDGRQHLKTSLSEAEYESAVLALRAAHLALGEPDEAIRVMTLGLKRLPYCFPLRQVLGMDLSNENRFSEAAEHLQWCAARQPDNKGLQQAAARAIKERLKSEPATSLGSVPRAAVAR